MAYNGVGVFVRLYSWVTDAANAVFIDATRMDNEMDGFAAGLTNCITKDGQSTPTANIPMGGFKITGLGDGVLPTDAATVGQLSPAAPVYFDVGNSGASATIDFNTNGPNQQVTLTNNATLTVSNGGSSPSSGRLKVIQDATGGRLITWAGANYSASRWIGSSLAPAFNTTASTTSFVDFYWDGTRWFQQHIGPVARKARYVVQVAGGGFILLAADSVFRTVLYTTTQSDPYSEYNAATGTFTAKVSGVYAVSLCIGLSNSTSNFVAAQIRATGAAYGDFSTANYVQQSGYPAAAGVTDYVSISSVIPLNAGGTILIAVRGDGGGTLTVIPGSVGSWLIARIGDVE